MIDGVQAEYVRIPHAGSSLYKIPKTIDDNVATSFCRFCGLELFKKCNTCDSENFAHLPFCSNCGDKITTENKKAKMVSKT